MRSFILQKYQIQDDNDESLTIVFSWEDGRSQMVVISSIESKSGMPWIEIKSPVGVIPTSLLNDALDSLFGKVCGGLIKVGDRCWVRHSMPIGDTSEEEFVFPLNVVATSADDLEERLVGGDVQ